MPPEPESTARGDVWAVGAVALSLCRLLRAGPIPPVPDGHRDPAAWAAKPQLRQGLEHMGAGSSYSNELDCVLRDTLRFDPRDRPRSYQLMALIRKGEAAVLRPGMVPVTNLPKWAFAKR